MKELAINMKNVTVRYGSQTILDAIDLQLETEQILTIVGPNGSGKSTLLKTLIGQIVPQQGSVELLGHSPNTAVQKGWLGYLPQTSSDMHHIPVLAKDIVALSRYALKKPFQRLNQEDKQLIDQALDHVSMGDLQDSPFSQLSGGQKQRVLIARALAVNPRLMLLDEPSTGLDMVAQESFYELLQTLKTQARLTIIMVSHDIGAVSGFVDQIACLNRKIHFHGKPRSGIPEKAIEQVFGKHIQFVLHDDHCKSCRKNR